MSPQDIEISVAKAHSHFCKRALERHGLKLDKHDIARIIAAVERGDGEFLKWSEGGEYRSLYRINIFAKPYIILFDFELRALITIFHNSWLKLEDGKWVDRVKTSHRRKQWLNRQDKNRRRTNVKL